MSLLRKQSMRLTRAVAIALLAGGVSAAGAAPASALTLGTTATSAGPDAFTCPAQIAVLQTGSDTSFTSRVPDGQSGLITSWSFNATATPPGASIGLLVAKPTSDGFLLTAVDFETVPVQAAPGVVTFGLATPLPIEAGGAIGLYAADGTIVCGSNVTAPSANATTVRLLGSPPAVGDVFPGQGGPAILNVSAEVSSSPDLSLTATAAAGSIQVGSTSSVIFPVGSPYPTEGNAQFVGTIPTGLHLVTAVAGDTPCSVLGTSFKCDLSLTGGVKPTVVLVVAADAPGTYQVTGSIGSGNTDETPADNTASAAITVVGPPAPVTIVGPPTVVLPACTTVSLGGLTRSVASRLLTALHCKPVVGKAKSSKTVKKGLVITTDPGPSKTLASGATVQIIPSSGKPKAAKKKTSKKKSSKK